MFLCFLFESSSSSSSLYSISTFCAAGITSYHLTIVVHGDIQDKIVQWLAGSFCTRDVEVTTSRKFLFLHPCWQLDDGSLAQMGWGEAFPFTGQVRNTFRLPSHSLASRSMLLTEVWSLQCPCDFLEPCVRVRCRPWISTVPHPNSPE